MNKLAAHGSSETSLFGLWVYLMTDCVLFASLFATFAVVRNSTAGGPSGGDLFSLPFVLTETLILLVSSFAIGMAVLAMHQRRNKLVFVLTCVTLVLGLLFLSLEFYEFKELVQEGHGWKQSAFLSAFFTLVGTHGIHIIVGVIWILVLIVKMMRGYFTQRLRNNLKMLAMYWHFLDVIWIFIFTIVYLLGAV